MSDPRAVLPQNRAKSANHSPLMRALVGKQVGDVVNFCPFQCEDHQLDENGFCGHLVGFYNGGGTFEPRVMQLDNKKRPTGRIITSGAHRQQMKKGFKLVKITTSARVYSPKIVDDLVPRTNEHLRGMADVMEQERQLLEFAERIRNPVLDGEWDGSVYDREPDPAAAAKPPA